jgi:putative peptidoglycan lipid II flippase
MVINTILCALLIIPFAHAGLTLASSIAGYVNCAILFFLLKKRGIYQPSPHWGRFTFQLLVANGVMSVYLIMISGNVAYWLNKPITMRLSVLLAHVFVAAIIYALCLLICGMRPGQFRGQIKE